MLASVTATVLHQTQWLGRWISASINTIRYASSFELEHVSPSLNICSIRSCTQRTNSSLRDAWIASRSTPTPPTASLLLRTCFNASRNVRVAPSSTSRYNEYCANVGYGGGGYICVPGQTMTSMGASPSASEVPASSTNWSLDSDLSD